MVRKLSISPVESDLSFTAKEDVKEVKDSGPFTSNFPKWSSRFNCLQAYICIVMGFISTLEHCKTIGVYGWAAYIAYAVYACVFGVPIVFVEVLLGRYVMGNVVRAWSMCPIARGVLVCLFGTTAYSIIINNFWSAYLLKYLFSFHDGYIPWSDCRKPWAKENCYVIEKNASAFHQCFLEHSEKYCQGLSWETSGTQYWKYVASNRNNTKEVALTIAYLAITTTLVALINLKGHRSCEKMFIVLVCIPVSISIIATYLSYKTAAVLSSITAYLFVEWNLLWKFRMWVEAFEAFLMSLGLATLALSFVSSHGKFTDNIFLDVLVVIFFSFFSPSLTAIPILCTITAMKRTYTGTPISNSYFISRNESSEAIFIWLSEAVVHFSSASPFWAAIIYLEMLLMAVGNQAIMFSAFCEGLMTFFPPKCAFLYTSIGVAAVMFALSVPSIFISFDFIVPEKTFTTTVVLLYAITLQLCYGFKKFIDDYHFMLGYPPSLWVLRVYWYLIIPLCLTLLSVKIYFRIPNIPIEHIVPIYISIPVTTYIFVALIQIFRAAKTKEVKSVFMADPNWGPANPVLKMSRVIFNSKAVTKEFLYRRELQRKPLMKAPDISQQNIVQLT